MSFENMTNMETTEELRSESTKLGAFQNPIWTESHDLMPKISFTTDKAEAEAAANADRSNPFDLPDVVFYVKPAEGADKGSSDIPVFQKPLYDVGDVYVAPLDSASDSGSSYVGPSIENLDYRIESDVKHLTEAELQLNQAIERGTGVITAMNLVESAQKVLDADMKLYNEAIKFRAPNPPVRAAQAESAEQTGMQRLGSVSNAQWKLEQAYKNDNKIAIENAKRELAHEKAKAEAKK